jgi:hypothetical protein
MIRGLSEAKAKARMTPPAAACEGICKCVTQFPKSLMSLYDPNSALTLNDLRS